MRIANYFDLNLLQFAWLVYILEVTAFSWSPYIAITSWRWRVLITAFFVNPLWCCNTITIIFYTCFNTVRLRVTIIRHRAFIFGLNVYDYFYIYIQLLALYSFNPRCLVSHPNLLKSCCEEKNIILLLLPIYEYH